MPFQISGPANKAVRAWYKDIDDQYESLIGRMDDEVTSGILPAVVRLTQSVGELLVDMQSTDDLKTRSKSDGSPVTCADLAAHTMLAHELPGIAPYLVVSEESGPQENAERLSCERVWIVDPLDGTRDYIKGAKAFTVNIALVENGIPVLGVIRAPRLGVTYYAERGCGAFRIVGGGATERIYCAQRFADDARLVVSWSDINLAWSSIPGFARARVEAVSSCVKLGFVAEGSAIAYPRLTPSSEWDIAAGHAIVLEAGGHVVGTDGCDLIYNKVNSLNTAFIATGSPHIAAAFASIFALASTP